MSDHVRFDPHDYDTFLIMAALRGLLAHAGVALDNELMVELERRMRALPKEEQ